jgi:hypothetical protein
MPRSLRAPEVLLHAFDLAAIDTSHANGSDKLVNFSQSLNPARISSIRRNRVLPVRSLRLVT